MVMSSCEKVTKALPAEWMSCVLAEHPSAFFLDQSPAQLIEVSPPVSHFAAWRIT